MRQMRRPDFKVFYEWGRIVSCPQNPTSDTPKSTFRNVAEIGRQALFRVGSVAF